MGKFINQKYADTVSSLVEGGKERLKNPYYLFTDKKPTIVTYYNINKDKTTMDEDSNLMESYTDENSPIRFNKIEQAHLFGINRAEIDLQIEEYGVESSSAPEGEAYILPGTFTPYPQDYFTIDYLEDKNLVFKIANVTPDTLENGANFWKVSYRLSLADEDISINKLEKLVVDDFIMNAGTYGTNLKTVIRKAEYDLIADLEESLNRMKNFYKDLFFKNRLQTFIYENKETYFYDSCMIEFLQNNKILSGADSYTYIHHELPVSSGFVLEYAKTFFYSLETKGKYGINMPVAYAILIEDKCTLMYQRPDDYYALTYKETVVDSAYPMEPFPSELLSRIKDNVEYEKTDPKYYQNLFIRYFNNTEIDSELITAVQQLQFEPNMEMFYMMPCIIFILEQFIQTIMKK